MLEFGHFALRFQRELTNWHSGLETGIFLRFYGSQANWIVMLKT